MFFVLALFCFYETMQKRFVPRVELSGPRSSMSWRGDNVGHQRFLGHEGLNGHSVSLMDISSIRRLATSAARPKYYKNN